MTREALRCLVRSSATAVWLCGISAQRVEARTDELRASALRDARVSVSLSRLPSMPGPILVLVRATDAQGRPLTTLDFEVTAARASVERTPNRHDGSFFALVIPAFISGEVPISVTVREAFGIGSSLRVDKTAVVLPRIGASWDQPEAVSGLVNTAGWEDGAEISPDGEWLLISSYSPVDLLCCMSGCGSKKPQDPTSPFCNRSLGPITGPARPGMLGAERIVSPTQIRHEAPSLGLVGPLPFAVPPVAGFGFHRQPDGSFAQSFVIGFQMDGHTVAPFGLTFVSAPQGTRAQLLFAYDDPRDNCARDTKNDLYWMDAQLGAPVILGGFQATAPCMVRDDPRQPFRPTRLELPSLDGDQGNPGASPGRVWFDDEGATEQDLRVAAIAGPLPNGAIAPSARVWISQSGVKETQPFLDTIGGSTLYFSRNSVEILSASLVGSTPWERRSWTPIQLELGAEAGTIREGAIVAIGEPSVAHPAGEHSWLYFVYVHRTATGLNANVGRVRRRF